MDTMYEVKSHIVKDYSDCLRSFIRKHISDKTMAEKIYNQVVDFVCNRYQAIDFDNVDEQGWIYGIAIDAVAAYIAG